MAVKTSLEKALNADPWIEFARERKRRTKRDRDQFQGNFFPPRESNKIHRRVFAAIDASEMPGTSCGSKSVELIKSEVRKTLARLAFPLS